MNSDYYLNCHMCLVATVLDGEVIITISYTFTCAGNSENIFQTLRNLNLNCYRLQMKGCLLVSALFTYKNKCLGCSNEAKGNQKELFLPLLMQPICG